jgi:hypothetical protein
VERDPSGRYVLDRMDGPTGPLRFVAFERDDSIRVGVTGDDGELLSDISMHGPSLDYEPFAWRDRGWAVAFGGVPPESVRAEVRNDDGDVFPATIVDLPFELGTNDRAAWGSIDRYEDDCLLVSFDTAGRRLTTIGDYAVGPRTAIGEGDDPVGGHWRMWIAHRELGPMLELRSALGGTGSGIGKLPVHGFGSGGVGRELLPDPKWEVSGLVTSLAERLEVTTSEGSKVAVVLTVPSREFGPCKAYVAFGRGDEQPRSSTAFDADGEVLATFDYETWRMD